MIESIDHRVNVVLFSGGRGSSVLTKQLLHHKEVNLALIINGYDDGLSTGEVRRFLGDCLGPSDFRKNASRVALELASCEPGWITLLDLRFPVTISESLVDATLSLLTLTPSGCDDPFYGQLEELHGSLEYQTQQQLAERMTAFRRALDSAKEGFDFSDCSIGNLVFAGSFLVCDRQFNRAVDDYSMLLGLPEGLIVNVTQGENAFLVATNENGEYLKSEADIVDAGRRNHIQDIFLLKQPFSPAPSRLSAKALQEDLVEQSMPLQLNPQVVTVNG